MSSLTDLDPTGVLSAAGAAVGLVGAVLRSVPALKNATNSIKSHSANNQGPTPLHRAQTSTEAPAVGIDSERERRAYETVNFVLREFGTRVCAAGLVDEHALTKALTAATQHTEVNLFSGKANRLFASLAPKLGDPILVNSVFTSIYFLGALTAELSRSLPNYKETYAPLGPQIVQQLFRTAIGEDAFRENLTANLDAYKTLATTAGLLRPTDIGYSSFPGFPAFSPCRYSSKSFGDVRSHRLIYEKLVRHFEKSGFPQPVASRQGEVGLIREWRFLDSDSPSRNFDIEKADKTIGESFGRVLHWLVCSADRLPPGQAIIAYYDQHIELVKWIGLRMGYYILHAASELDLGGAHAQLDNKSRAILRTWVLLMPSEKAQGARRAHSAQWAQTHKQTASQAPPVQISKPQPPQPTKVPVQLAPAPPEKMVEIPPIASPVVPPLGPHFVAKDSGPVPTRLPPKTIDERLDDVDRDFNDIIVPQCQRLLSKTPSDPNARNFEYKRLTQHIERGVIDWLDGFPMPEVHPARARRKDMIVQAQKLLDALGLASKNWSAGSPLHVVNPDQPVVSPAGSIHHNLKPEIPFSPATEPTPSLASPQSQPSPTPSVSPPPYSPTSPPSATGSTNTGVPFPGKPVIRRKAPPPPKKFIAAKALYDFEPEEDYDEELAFKEGDDIEIVEKTAALEEEGWCRARVKGQKKFGLVPLEYLVEVEPTTTNKPPAPAQTSGLTSFTAAQSTPASICGQLNSSSAGHPMNGTSIASMISPQASLPLHLSGPMASSHPAAYTNNPQLYGGSPGPTQNTRKLGKGTEIAGVAVATAGTAAGMATFMQGSETQSQTTETTATTGVQPASEPSQLTGDTTPQNLPVTEETVTVDQTNTTEVVENDPIEAYAPPAIDLSAFSSTPFEPQPTMDQSNPVAELATTDPYFAAQNPSLVSPPDFNSVLAGTGVPQGPAAPTDTGYEPPMAVSPFAAQATPAPAIDAGVGVGASGLGTPPDPPDLIEYQSVPATTMTQQSPEAAVDNVECTQWEASNQEDCNQEDYAAYDMDV